MAATNVASAPIATGKSEPTASTTPAPRFNRLTQLVMAKVIEFYVPNSYRKPFRTAVQPQPGKVIEFYPPTKRSA